MYKARVGGRAWTRRRGQQRSDAPSLGRTTLNAAAYQQEDSDGEEDVFSDEEDFTGDMVRLAAPLTPTLPPSTHPAVCGSS